MGDKRDKRDERDMRNIRDMKRNEETWREMKRKPSNLPSENFLSRIFIRRDRASYTDARTHLKITINNITRVTSEEFHDNGSNTCNIIIVTTL